MIARPETRLGSLKDSLKSTREQLRQKEDRLVSARLEYAHQPSDRLLLMRCFGGWQKIVDLARKADISQEYYLCKLITRAFSHWRDQVLKARVTRRGNPPL